MADIFDTKIVCKQCNKEMRRSRVEKNGFCLRAVTCPTCRVHIIHPKDEREYDQFTNLRNKKFHVKMRFVGNSYAVSIPKEIVNFMKEQEELLDDMVNLCFEDFGRISLRFGPCEDANINKHVVIKSKTL